MGNRRALRDIENLVRAPLPFHVTKKQLTEKNVASHRPVTRSFAASLAKKEALPPVANPLTSTSVAVYNVTDHKPLSDSPIPMVEEFQAMNLFGNLCLPEKSEQPEVEMEDDCLQEKSEQPVVEIEMEDVSEDNYVVDIDSADGKDPLKVVDYVEEIYRTYRDIEETSCVDPHYMAMQPDINEGMRAILIDRLIGVHYKFALMPETLYLTVNIIDRFLERQNVQRKKLLLVGVTAMLLACKYEEVSVPVVEDLVQISDHAYTRQEILDMEWLIVKTLQFNMSVPTPYVFMKRFLQAAQSDRQMELLSFFLVELCMVDYNMLSYKPSLLAAAAVYTAQCSLKGRKLWTETSQFYSTYSEDQLVECSRLMVDLRQKAATGELTAVHRKYSTYKYHHSHLCIPTLSFAASLAKKEALPPVANPLTSTSVAVYNVTDHKPLSDSPIPMVEEFQAMNLFGNLCLPEKSEQPEVEMEDDCLQEKSEQPVVEIEMEDVSEDNYVVDIDSADGKDPLKVVDYVEEIYRTYRDIEETSCVDPHYMAMQPDINEGMRAILIDRLIGVHYKFALMPETLYLTVNIIDRFLERQNVQRKKLLLVGVTAMLLACKYEEVSVPVVEDLVQISDHAYTRQEILDMEWLIVKTLQFNMSVPTPYVFMKRFLQAAQSDRQMELLSFFLVELCMVDYNMLSYKPSLLAAAAVYTAQCSLKGRKLWTETSQFYSTYSEDQLVECSRLMVDLRQKAATGELTAVHRKYSTYKYHHSHLRFPTLYKRNGANIREQHDKRSKTSIGTKDPWVARTEPRFSERSTLFDSSCSSPLCFSLLSCDGFSFSCTCNSHERLNPSLGLRMLDT